MLVCLTSGCTSEAKRVFKPLGTVGKLKTRSGGAVKGSWLSVCTSPAADLQDYSFVLPGETETGTFCTMVSHAVAAFAASEDFKT